MRREKWNIKMMKRILKSLLKKLTLESQWNLEVRE